MRRLLNFCVFLCAGSQISCAIEAFYPENDFMQNAHLQEKEHLAVVRALRSLDTERCLRTLEVSMDVVEKKPIEHLRTCRGVRKNKFVTWLSQRKGQRFKIHELYRELDSDGRKSRSMRFFLSELLNLALDGWPVDYDKNSETLGFFSESAGSGVGVPASGATLCATVYDLLCLYPRGISVDELAYYAYREGYWRAGESWHKNVKAYFKNRIALYKYFLIVLGLFGEDALCEDERPMMLRRIKLWEFCQNEDPCLKEVRYYRKKVSEGVCEDDITFVEDLRCFEKSDHYLVLKKLAETKVSVRTECEAKESDAVCKPPCADLVGVGQEVFGFGDGADVRYDSELKEKRMRRIVEKNVCIYPCSYNDLWLECKLYGMTLKQFWRVVGDLACGKGDGEGTLCYDPSERMFYWDQHGVVPPLVQQDNALEILRLLHTYPDITADEVLHMLRQKNFKHACMTNVDMALSSLDLLGLKRWSQTQEKGKVVLRRKMFEISVEKEEALGSYLGATHRDVNIVSRAFSWVQKGLIVDLCKAHLRKYECVRKQGRLPPQKRLKLEWPETDYKQFASDNIPNLCQYLCKKGVL